MINFTTLSQAELVTFVVERKEEMAASGITFDEVMSRLGDGSAVVEARTFGFALVELKPTTAGPHIPHLWLLYVDPQHRGKKVGHRFVRELLTKYARDYHMSLSCEGPARRRFFGRLGFVVEGRDGEMRRMTTNKQFYR